MLAVWILYYVVVHLIALLLHDSDLTFSDNVHVIQVDDISKLECGPMPNVMVTLPNIGGALCSTPQSLADAHY